MTSFWYVEVEFLAKYELQRAQILRKWQIGHFLSRLSTAIGICLSTDSIHANEDKYAEISNALNGKLLWPD